MSGELKVPVDDNRSRHAIATDGWRLVIGTLTVMRWRPPTTVTLPVGGAAMALAPLAGLVLGVAAGVVLWGALQLGTGSLLAAVLSVGTVQLGVRAFHLDGLADTVDGLTASYDRERSLAVMHTGDVGPAGAAALAVVLALQVAGVARLADLLGAGSVSGEIGAGGEPTMAGALVAAAAVGGCVVVSRATLVIACRRGVPAARQAGLGAMVAGAVAPLTAVAVLTVVTGGVTAIWLSIGGATGTAGIPWWAAPVAVVAAAVGTLAVVARSVRRFGGVTGDVFGAVVEVSLAAALIGMVVAVA